MKKLISLLMVGFCLSNTVFAGVFTPNRTQEYKQYGYSYLKNSYNVKEINQYEFENNIEEVIKQGLKVYELCNTKKTGGTITDSREETQIKIVETNTDKIEEVLSEFPTEIEYDEDGYTGRLYIDTSSVTTTQIADGSTTRAYTVTETVTYNNLSKNDLDKIPKTKVKNGVQMRLISADWKVISNEMAGNYQVPNAYNCYAHYKGTGYRKIAGEAKYTSSATYKGTIIKSETEDLVYDLTYMKTADYTWTVILSSVGVILLITGIGILLYSRNKRKSQIGR